MMGVTDKPLMRNSKIVPLEAHGVKLMSIGFILDPEKALIWRGPLVAQLITQFLNDVDWGELDYLVIDLPPGTGDVQLTLVQKIPISGAVIVTTPQEVALADARQGAQDVPGGEDADPRHRREHERLRLPELRRAPRHLRRAAAASAPPTSTASSSSARSRSSPTVREGGDAGTPVVVAAPESAHRPGLPATLAERVASRLAVDAVKKPRKPTIMLRTVR